MSRGAGAGSMDELALEVRNARDALARQRQGNKFAEITARADLLRALEHYVAALDRRHLPIPHALQCELRTQRAVEGL